MSKHTIVQITIVGIMQNVQIIQGLHYPGSTVPNASFPPNESEPKTLTSLSVNSWIENNGTHFLATSVSLRGNEPQHREVNFSLYW